MHVIHLEHHPTLSFGWSPFLDEPRTSWSSCVQSHKCGVSSALRSWAEQFCILSTSHLSVTGWASTTAAPVVSSFFASIHLACSSRSSGSTILFFFLQGDVSRGHPKAVCQCVFSATQQAHALQVNGAEHRVQCDSGFTIGARTPLHDPLVAVLSQVWLWPIPVEPG